MTVYINPAHTRHSPGGCFGGRREYEDNRVLAAAVIKELSLISPDTPIRLFEGSPTVRELSSDGILLVLHRGVPDKGEKKRGAFICVGEDADSRVQYEAFRMLSGITGEDAFRYLGVHTQTAESPFRRFGEVPLKRKYLLSVGCIDSEEDNTVFSGKIRVLARNLAAVINEICKEAENEDNIAI